MALRALMLAKSIKDKRDALTALEAVDFAKRSAEIEASIAEAQTEEERAAVEASVAEFETEKADTDQKIETLRGEIAQLESELAEIEAAAPAETGTEERPLERKEQKPMEIRESREYINAYVDYLKKGDESQIRSLLTENAVSPQVGYIPVPTYVENRIRQAWENDEVFRRVTRTYLRGNVKVGFEISASEAAYHNEGAAAPDEETIVLGIVTMIPKSIKKWISISDEALDLNGEAFLDYIVDEITYKIIKFAAAQIVTLIAASPAASTATAPQQAQLTAAPAIGTVAAAMALLSDQASNPVVILNKATWGAFKAAQYAGQFNVDPFEGLDVVFTSALPAYDTAATGAVYMIVGDLGAGAQANFPNGDAARFKINDNGRAKEDLVEVVGRMYVGLGVVTPNAFANVLKPANA